MRVCDVALIAIGLSHPAYGDGILKSRALVRVRVVESVRVEHSMKQLDLVQPRGTEGVKLGEVQFSLERSTSQIPYEVWITAPREEPREDRDKICHAAFDQAKIPIEFTLSSIEMASHKQVRLGTKPGNKVSNYKIIFSVPANINMVRGNYPPGNYRVKLVNNISQDD